MRMILFPETLAFGSVQTAKLTVTYVPCQTSSMPLLPVIPIPVSEAHKPLFLFLNHAEEIFF